jgi:AcrR family transcriptional regulator
MSPGMAFQEDPDQHHPSTPGATLAYRQAMGETPAPVRPTPGDAFNAARERFRAGGKLDMVALADQLGISRATLYRWTGDRDRLLADILIAELHSLIGAATTHATGTGVERLESAIGWFLDTLAGLPSLRAFLINESDNGLRMVTSPTGPVRPRIVETVTEVINRETVEGHYRPPAPPELLADGIIALAERYLHNGGDPALNPDPTTARTIAGLLLREPCA